MGEKCRILYCQCAHAKIVPEEVKNAVLDGLCESDVSWEGVSDLCEMVARRDPSVKHLNSGGGKIKIAACYPRAVKWLFASAGAPLDPEEAQILNMREEAAEDVIKALLDPHVEPNIPEGKGKAPVDIASEEGITD